MALLRAGSWDGGEGGWGKAYQVVVVRPLRPMVPILGLYLVGLSLYWLLAVREARERRALAACVHGAERGDPARGIPPARR